MSIRHVDVAVVGSGIAGLYAAMKLNAEGANVLVIDAECKVGGRCSTHYEEEAHTEEGAIVLMNNAQGDLFQLIKRLGLDEKLVPHSQIQAADKVYRSSDGTRHLFSADISQVIPTQHNYTIGQMTPAILKGFSDSVPDDTRSVADMLRSNGIDQALIDAVQITTPLGQYCPFKETSASAFSHQMEAIKGEPKVYSLKGGNNQLPQAMAETLDGKVLLNTRVRTIEQTEGQVTLTANLVKIVANKVILACPLPALSRIQFNPPLSVEKQDAITRLSHSYLPVARVTLFGTPDLFKGPPRLGLFSVSEANPCGTFMDLTAAQKNPSKHTVIMFNCTGEEANLMRDLSEVERVNRVVSGLDLPSSIDPNNFKSHFIYRGAGLSEADPIGVFNYPTGTFNLREKLAQNEGSLFFAGEQITYSAMNGALKSGYDAAEEVLTVLKSQESSEAKRSKHD